MFETVSKMNIAFAQASVIGAQRLTRSRMEKKGLCSSPMRRRRVTIREHKPAKRSTISLTASPHSMREDPPRPSEEKRGRDVKRLANLFWRLAVPYWKREPSARKDFLGVIALTVLQSGVAVGFSFISKDFWTALNTKNSELFMHQAGLFFGALVLFTPIVVYYQYFRDRCAIKWREWMTETVLDEYVARRNFYNLDADGTVDNPDQRIAQDLQSFTSESISLLLTLLVSCIDLASFSAILFSIYPPLFGILVAYAITGTALTSYVGKNLITLNYKQLVREADLRYSLIRFRDNAESVAFFGGERREQKEISRRLRGVVDNMMDVIGLQRQLGFLQTGYRYIVQILPAFAVAPLYFKGQIELGSVTQSFGAFSHILGDLSLIVTRFDALTQFGAGIDRLGEFVEALEENLDEKQRVFHSKKSDALSAEEVPLLGNGIVANKTVIPSRITLQETDDPSLSIRSLTLSTPTGTIPRVLIENLTLSLEPGGRLLVAGPSGVGKSSLLRAIAGLWDNGSGTIARPGTSNVFFLPQKPYCTLGTLRQNMLYPHDERVDGRSDAALMRILDLVDLHELPARMGGFDVVKDWGDILSEGEKQRLNFGRLLLAKPTLAIIDEGSAALSIDAEARMYGLLETMGITVVSIGHRPSLLKYHDFILRLRGEGSSWELEGIKQSQKDRIELQTL